MLSREDNDLLCRVEGDAPMGRLMRAHWMPACLSEEVAEPDGAPVRIRLLGEELVAFRDTAGRLGVLDEHCPHRRASLALGRNEECGLRCLYHGWKIDVEGTIVDSPSEPPGSRIAAARQAPHVSLPRGGRLRLGVDGRPGGAGAVSAAGVGAVARTSAPASSRCTSTATGRRCSKARSIPRTARACTRPTWCRRASTAPARRAKEWLRPSTDKAPRLARPAHAASAFATSRSAVRSSDADTHDYLRITLFVAPFTVLIPPNDRYNLSILNIPLDDAHTMFYFIAWSEGEGIEPGRLARVLRRAASASISTRDYRSLRTQGNDYLQDREAMDAGSHTGHRRHSEPGHGDVGNDGADRRPFARAARRERRRHRALPPHHGGGRARAARRRSGDRHRLATHSARERCARSRASCRSRPTGRRSAPRRRSSTRPRRQRSSEAFALTRPGGRRHTARHKPA